MADSRSTRLSRRRLVRSMAGALALFGFGRFSAAGASEKFRVFQFDPFAVDLVTGASCRGCAACQRHAEHKRFASFEAAELQRAHPHCRCAIRSELVARDVYVGLFEDPDGDSFRDTFDARWPGASGKLPTLPSGGLEMPVVGVR